MKHNRLKKVGLVLLGLFVWYLLLVAMVAFEQGIPDASIKSFGDAFWFSLVTLTTVGYGDFFPVSPLGKMVGIVFILLSVGFFSLLISLFISMVQNQAIPRMKLGLQKNQNWYYFSEINPKTLNLAEDIRKSDRDGIVIFEDLPDFGNQFGEKCQRLNALCFSTSPEELVGLKKGNESQLNIFYMSEMGYENYRKGMEFAAYVDGRAEGSSDGKVGRVDAGSATGKSERGKVKIYCETEFRPECNLPILTCFDQYDTTARLFWHRNPLKREKNHIVLVGLDQYGTRLLERAFLTNIYGESISCTYHVFGDSEAFRATHTSMLKLLCDSPDSEDRIHFYEKSWYHEAKLLETADMILLCEDQDSKNFENLQIIRKSFPVSGQIFLKSEVSLEEVKTFGAIREIYTAEQVLRESLTKTAKALHKLYEEKSRTSGRTAPSWEELPEILRQSNIAAADHLLIKARILLNDLTLTELTQEICEKAGIAYQGIQEKDKDLYWRLEHVRWMRFFAIYNFRCGEKNLAMKTHPNYVGYDKLDYDTKSYDDNEWKLLGELGDKVFGC